MPWSECACHCWEIKARSGARKNPHSGRGGVFLDIPFYKTHRPVRRGFERSHLDCVSYQKGMSLLSTRTARRLLSRDPELLTACRSIGASWRQRQLRWPCPFRFQKDFRIDCGDCVLHLRPSQPCICWRPRRCRSPAAHQGQGIIPRETVLQFRLDRAVTVAPERQEATAKVTEPASCLS